LRAHIQALNMDEAGRDDSGKALYVLNPGGWAFDAIGFSLVEIVGLEDFEADYEDVKIGNTPYTRLKDYCLDVLPRALFDEIYTRVNEALVLAPEAVEEVGFTPDSSTVISSVPETSDTVVVEPELRSDSPSPITDAENLPSSGDACGSESAPSCDI